jgi:RNA polymerase sigma factor (sigma-70 family)
MAVALPAAAGAAGAGAMGAVADPVAVAVGDAACSFEAFYASALDRVFRALALTVGDVDLARESADEAMVRAYERWSTVGRMDNPGGWAYRVGLNWATSRWRRRRREVLVADTPDAHDDGTDAHGHALDALGTLELDQRAVVVCRAVLSMSTAETAAALRLPEGTVKSRLSRGLATLRATMGEEVDG